MMRLYSGCGTRRLTSTTMVFCILVETTSPIFSFLIPWACCSAMLFLFSSELSFTQDGEDTGAGLAHRAGLLQAFHLTHGHLKLKTKHLLVHFRQLPLQFGGIEIAHFLRLHILSLLPVFPADDLGLDRQLVSRQTHRRSRRGKVHAFHLEQDLTGANHRDPL